MSFLLPAYRFFQFVTCFDRRYSGRFGHLLTFKRGAWNQLTGSVWMEVLHWRVFWSEVWMGNLQGQYLWVFLLGLVSSPQRSHSNLLPEWYSLCYKHPETGGGKAGGTLKKPGAPADRPSVLWSLAGGYWVSTCQVRDRILDCFLNSFQPIFILVATFIFISRNSWYSNFCFWAIPWGINYEVVCFPCCTLAVSFLGSVKSIITGPSAFQLL